MLCCCAAQDDALLGAPLCSHLSPFLPPPGRTPPAADKRSPYQRVTPGAGGKQPWMVAAVLLRLTPL